MMCMIITDNKVCVSRVTHMGYPSKSNIGRTADASFKELEFSEICFALISTEH